LLSWHGISLRNNSTIFSSVFRYNLHNIFHVKCMIGNPFLYLGKLD
jgi:hypothetical protein